MSVYCFGFRTGSATTALIFMAILSSPVSMAEEGVCLSRPIVTRADVTPSSGSPYSVQSYFRAVDDTAVRFVDEHEQVIAIQGALSWLRIDGEIKRGGEQHKLFALGHQFHAILINFEGIMTDIRGEEGVAFGGEYENASAGAYPYGGTVYKLEADAQGRTPGLVFELPDTPRIEVRFSGWKDLQGQQTPYRLSVDDGSAVFDYEFTQLKLSESGESWFSDLLGDEELDRQMADAEPEDQRVRNCEDTANTPG